MMVQLNNRQADLLRTAARGQVEGNTCGDCDPVCLEEANLDVVLSLMFLNCVRISPKNQVILTYIGEEYYRELFR